MKQNAEFALWKYAFPVLSGILWIATIVLFFKANGSYHTGDLEAQQAIWSAIRWQPACCVGAVLSTVASFVVFSLAEHLDSGEN